MQPADTPHIHWFSPLPPERSGISEFATIVIPSLAALGPLSVWSTRTETRASLGSGIDLRRYIVDVTALPCSRNDVCIFNLGNSSFHDEIWRVSLRKPGIVVLHDTHLDSFRDRMRAVFPGDFEHFVNRQRATKYATAQPLEGLGIESSLGVVAHTDLAVQEVQELGLECRKADLPYAWERTSERRIGPRAQRDRRKKLVIFGHIDSNRRVDSVIQALASMNERDQFRLDIFGLVYPRNLEVLARVSGNHRNVKFHGYVSDARLDEALATADLGINLRHPTMGESSISQLRFWAHGVPTVCTREGWYAELDETLTEFVRTEHEIDDLRRVFRRLLDDPEYFRAMGRRGRERLATKHNPARYADMIWSYARDILASNGVVR